MGINRRLGNWFVAMMMPVGCTPSLDCGGCTMIFGSICASSQRVAAPVFGTMNCLSGVERVNGGSESGLTKSIQGFAGSGGV